MTTSPEVQKLRDRARLLCDLGRYREAIPLLHRALGMAPDDADILCRLCSVYYYLKDWKQAHRYADAAVAADPESAWGHALRGQVLIVRNRGREAVKATEEAVRLAPHHADYLRPLFYAYMACQRFKEAENAATRFREARPDNASPYELLATIAQQRGRLKEAEAYLRQARALDPTSSEIQRRMALLQSRRKRTPETFQDLYAAVRLDPASREAMDSLTSIAFNFSGFPMFLLASVAGLAIVIMGPLLHINAGQPYLAVLLLITLPVIPVHRLHPEWLLSWQPGVRRLPLELQENLILIWRRCWMAYSAGFFILTIVLTLLMTTLFTVLSLLLVYVGERFLHHV